VGETTTRWTTTTPTAPGWYWFQTGDAGPAVVRVWRDPKDGTLYVASGNGKWPVAEWLSMADDGMWAGPLVPPAR
jgi:hypothetical protein